MPSRKLEYDEPFFREWRARASDEKRSLSRALHLMGLLGLRDLSLPVLAVVGSKGKATTAIYASAALVGAGLKVGTQTSPPIIDNRERIRVDGIAVEEAVYANLSHRLSALLDLMPPSAGSGYLSPTGLFTIMGVRYMVDQGCNVIVLEAGIGGVSDEISLFSPSVVAVTRVFSEHADVLGPTIVDIAENKVGIVTSSTRSVFSVAQSDDVREVIERRLRLVGSELTWVRSESWKSLVVGARGLSEQNAWLGVRAGWRLAEIAGVNPEEECVARVVRSVLTPGRLSVHRDQDGRAWVIDACIDGLGAAAALEYCEKHVGAPTTVFVSIPDGKDVAGVRSALSTHPFVPVALDEQHLEFSRARWDRPLIPAEHIAKYAHGNVILAVGTWSFVSVVLDQLHVTAYEAFCVKLGATGSHA